MFLRICSTVFSCGAAATAGVCIGAAMPRLDSETVKPWLTSDFCARAEVKSIKALAHTNATTRSLRILSFIVCSEGSDQLLTARSYRLKCSADATAGEECIDF